MEADRHFGEDVVLELPLVRFFTWDKPSISFGCNQNAQKRLDLALCRDDGIPVVRRPTGGRELLHGHDICYSVTIPVSASISGISGKVFFGEVNDVLVLGLKELGIDAQWSNFANRPKTTSGPCFAQIDSGEIMIGGRKLVASAQRVYPRSIVQQGSMPLNAPEIELLKYLRLSDKDLMTRRTGEMTAYLKDHLNGATKVVSIIGIFREVFEEKFGGCSRSADGIYDDFRKEYSGI
jgi:lipoate-protein ligase A